MLNFIVNTTSGHGLGKKNLSKIVNYCCKNKIEYAVHITGSVGHAKKIAQKLSIEDCGTIVAVGGDGTFHEVLNGVVDPSKTAVGFIPSGRGNDFARGVGIPTSVDKAMDIIVKGETDYFDYINIGGKRCLNVGGTGLDIDVLERVAGRNGKITYLKSLIYCISHFEPYHIEITEENGETREEDVIMMGVCNGKQFGGGMKISPKSDVRDGLMDVTIITMPADGKILPILPSFVKGKHEKIDVINTYRCKKIHVKTQRPIQLDGEIYSSLDMDCEIVECGLKTFRVNK